MSLMRRAFLSNVYKKGTQAQKAQAESHYLSFLAAPEIRITQYDATCSAGKLVVLQSRSQS